MHAGLDRVGAQGWTDCLFAQVVHFRRQRPRAQHQRQVLRLLRREAPEDLSVVGDAAVDPGRGEHLVVEHDGQVAADVLLRQRSEAAGAVVAQREADRRLIVLIQRLPGAAQVATGDRRDAAEDVVDGAARRRPGVGRIARARHDRQVRRQVVVVRLQRRLLRRERTLLHQLQLEQTRRTDDVLGAVHIVEAGKLDADVVAVLSLTGDARLGDAELVDATLDRLLRLDHRLFTQLTAPRSASS